VVALLIAGGAHEVKAQPRAQVLEVLSSRPDVISGGDTLVELRTLQGSRWSAILNGREVTASFRRSQSGELLAMLSGLRQGKNVLEIKEAGLSKTKIILVDHSLSGPIFSGPHQTPFVCQTEANGLGPALDADCSAKTIMQYYYKSTEPAEVGSTTPPSPARHLSAGFKTYDPSAPRPEDVAQTVTSDGHAVPYIVRREIGTINRAVYDIQFLHEPGQPLPTPWTRSAAGWNGRLIYLVDGGCGPGYHQGTLDGPVGAAGEPFLAAGYATATSTLNVAGTDCSDHISAESLSMVKEHFVKMYGRPVHTFGWGGSAGAYNQLLAAQNYPGLLDGLITGISFPDFFTSAQSVTDCALLDRAFRATQQTWSDPQKAAVAGFSSWQTCQQGSWPILDPSKLCPSLLPKDAIYDRKKNPKGIRCDLYDNEINVLGRDPRTGHAYRPLDNVGVQYGLVAFERGQIDAEQFVDLNERVGGFDDDGEAIPGRTVADPQSLRNAYGRGVVLTGGGGLSQVPIIDWRQYADDAANNHDSVRSFITRARLMAANGEADNQIILTFPRWSATGPDQARYLVQQMDRWLDNIAADGVDGTLAAKVVRDKPGTLADGCWATNGEHIVERRLYRGQGRCDQEYPAYADPRIVAGGPLTVDVLKCVLKPIRETDYSRPLTPDQLVRLKVVFPTGVCDYGRPGVGQEISTAIWQRY
jgi:hypothetical protein